MSRFAVMHRWLAFVAGLAVVAALASPAPAEEAVEKTIKGVVACTEMSPCLKGADGKTYQLLGGEFFVGETVNVTGFVEKENGRLVLDVVDYEVLGESPEPPAQDEKNPGQSS